MIWFYHLGGGAGVVQSEELSREHQTVKPYQVLSCPKPGKNMSIHDHETFLMEQSEINVN